MNTNLCILTLTVSIASLAIAGHALKRESSAPSEADLRVGDLEERLARLEVADTSPAPRTDDGPHLRGRMPGDTTPASTGTTRSLEGNSGDDLTPRAGESAAAPGDAHATLDRIEALVTEGVEKKAGLLQVMRDKRPALDLFAKTLELTDRQRFEVEQEVLRGQREIHALLATPRDDGSLFLDDLAEVLARSIVDPDQERKHWAGFIGRLLSERVPGTDETYAVRAEAAKASVRSGFRRTLSAEQYATFETWLLDPTEIQGVEESPWRALEERVGERVRALRATLPDRG